MLRLPWWHLLWWLLLSSRKRNSHLNAKQTHILSNKHIMSLNFWMAHFVCLWKIDWNGNNKGIPSGGKNHLVLAPCCHEESMHAHMAGGSQVNVKWTTTTLSCRVCAPSHHIATCCPSIVCTKINSLPQRTLYKRNWKKCGCLLLLAIVFESTWTSWIKNDLRKPVTSLSKILRTNGRSKVSNWLFRRNNHIIARENPFIIPKSHCWCILAISLGDGLSILCGVFFCRREVE